MTIPSTVSDVAPTNGKLKSDRTASLKRLLNLRPTLETPSLDADTKAWLQELRDRATAKVQELAIPSTRDEEWRFTDLSDILKVDFQTIDQQILYASLKEIEPFILQETFGVRLVFVNGQYEPILSDIKGALLSELIVGNLTLTLKEELKSRLANYLSKQQGSEEVFTTLNTASLTDAAIIWISKNQVIEEPIHLLFVSTTEDGASVSHPRCLVVTESNSGLNLIEDYVSIGEGKYFTNAVTEIWVGENAEVNHTRIQRDSDAAFHIGKTAVSQARNSRYTCNAVSLGAKLSRHNLEVYHTGQQTETTLNGLTIINGEQVADTHSTIAYSHPHGSSNQIHKCIVDDRAHAVFNGKVFVPKAAQLTDAKQLSSNLLLSPKARVDTKPQLEITADNVKCTHGATVSQLDSDEVFYLQSRGIDEDSARKLLTYAFAYEVIREIPVASLREKLAAIVREQQT